MIYSQDYIIDYHQLDINLKVTLPKLLTYLQETATRHSDDSGITMDYLFEHKVGWVLINWNVKILKMPSWRDKITIETAPELFKGIVAYRGFWVKNEAGEVIAYASSKWVFTSRELRRPIRAEKELVDKYGELRPMPLEGDFKISDISTMELIKENEILVGRRDMDSNRHVNNISYIDWALELIEDEVYYSKDIVEARLTYKKECLAGDKVYLKCYKNDETYIVLLNDADQNSVCEFEFVLN